MRAMILERTAPFQPGDRPLRLVELPPPQVGAGEVLIQVAACGVCHTELDEIEGRTPPPQLPVIPGHEIIGRVTRIGAGTVGHSIGDRVGVGWIHHSCGGDRENVSPEFRATGRDEPGGYAEYVAVPAAYVYPIPDVWSDVEAAPLLCAGAIGYRALRLTGIQDGDPIGLSGFGGSAHLVMQLLRHRYPRSEVFVLARSEAERSFALELGANWSGDFGELSPRPWRAAIDTTPAWRPVIESLRNLAPGGRLVINAIRKEDRDQSELLNLSYHEHLWMEREIKTVANITSRDITEYLPIAAEIPLRPHAEIYELEEANRALDELKHRPIRGAKVLRVEPQALQHRLGTVE